MATGKIAAVASSAARRSRLSSHMPKWGVLPDGAAIVMPRDGARLKKELGKEGVYSLAADASWVFVFLQVSESCWRDTL